MIIRISWLEFGQLKNKELKFNKNKQKNSFLKKTEYRKNGEIANFT